VRKLQFPAVVEGEEENKVVHIFDPYEGRKILTVPYETYKWVKDVFSNGLVLTEDQVIRPNAVINYLEESNPILLETEIQIEKNKERRRARNTIANLLPWISIIAMLLIVGAIAFAIIQNAGGNVAQAVKNVVPGGGAPISIKLLFWLLGG